MREQVKKKLQNQRGASIIITMVLFLLCVMVSSVIIAAAASGSSRNVERTERERAYLSVTSAANVLVDEFENGNTGGSYDTGSGTFTGTATLAGVVKEAVNTVTSPSASPYEKEFTMDLSTPDERLPEVKGKFYMNAKGKITILLETAVSDYSVTIVIPCKTGSGVSTIMWNSPQLEKGGAKYAK